MGQAVLAQLDQFPTVWNTQVIIPAVVEDLRTTITELQAVSKKQEENHTPGFTRTKDNEMEKLIDATQVLTSKLRAFGKINRDELVLESSRHSYSSLEGMPVPMLLQTSKIAIEQARNKLPQLTNFGITEESIVSVEAIHAEVTKLINQRDIAGGTRKSATDTLPELFTQMRDKLDLLDDLIDGMIEDEAFTKVYYNLRRVNDRGGRGAKPEDLN